MAIDEEIATLERNDKWELTELLEGHKTISVKWVYKTKLKENGKVDTYKSRLVAKGYKQEFGVDYKEVFAPVARHDTIRLVISLAAHLCLSSYLAEENLEGAEVQENGSYNNFLDLNNDGVTDLKYCKGEDQLADIFTKPIKLFSFRNLRRLMGVCTLEDPV
ncbi:uncharacterized mitochondrial protein AtMg00820-like [Gossypium hirsutum]|uniref:Uncharacterized mitochondrial protein AtMg00820-like n=1 Tax=Gossypium hirsutum TaxID=3635 RepID=A0A1U8NVN0_GOSHI|nr:uncharacterized mitochondrial protein AtMg00820-like [Gossypium hirsutum]